MVLQEGNEAGLFRLEADGTLRLAARLVRRARARHSLRLRVFDNGAPPLYADAAVLLLVVERSRHAPLVPPLRVLVCWGAGGFPGGPVGQVRATDLDPHDTLTYSLSPADAPFEIEAASGEVRAPAGLAPGEYRLTASASDGAQAGSGPVTVRVVAVTAAMLRAAVVLRLRALTPTQFLGAHYARFAAAVADAMQCAPDDVLLLSLQPSAPPDRPGEGEGEGDNELRRRKRQVPTYIQQHVLFY